MFSSSDEYMFHFIVFFLLIMSLPVYIMCQFQTAAYGKHYNPASETTISPALAWFVMESPTLWLTILLFPFGKSYSNSLSYYLMFPYIFHYFNRTIIYPIRLYFTSKKNNNKGFPLNTAVKAFIFNLLNGYIQSRYVSHYANFDGDEKWFWLRFSVGLAIFAIGMMVNVWADGVLLGLKNLKNQGGGYKIPRGGLYEYVSCPNYFGEIMEWLGWALMLWSWTGLTFFLFTCANLVPRAVATHNWYLEKFGEDYPKTRDAVFPFLY